MRYSKEHKLETHARIVQKASVRLREKGAHGVGVADLMKDAGLTHGGFYAHFASREQLLIEAFAYAMDRSTERWRKLAADTPLDQRLPLVVNSYLSAAHRDDPGRGCAVPALGAEIARESSKTRKAFAAKLDEMIETIASNYVDAPPKAARRQAMTTLATMMGGLLMARIAGTGELSDTILQAGREAALAGARSAKPSAKLSVATSAKRNGASAAEARSAGKSSAGSVAKLSVKSADRPAAKSAAKSVRKAASRSVSASAGVTRSKTRSAPQQR